MLPRLTLAGVCGRQKVSSLASKPVCRGSKHTALNVLILCIPDETGPSAAVMDSFGVGRQPLQTTEGESGGGTTGRHFRKNN